eukprot:g21383.t1
MANGFHHTTSSGTESIIQQTCTLLLAGWCAEEFGAFYFIFLTNWNLILQTFTTICLFLCAIWGYTVSPESSGKAPCFDPYPVTFSSYWAHLLNWMVLLFSLFASRIDFSPKNGIWLIIFVLIYFVWTIIHYVAEIGREKPCDNYPQELCPIYDLFNWNEPGLTIGITIAALVAAAVVIALYWGFVRCRNSCCDRGAQEAAVKDEAREPEVDCCLAITFLGHQLAHLGFYVNLYEWAYGIYLTNWTLLLQTVSECLLFALALQGSRRLSSQNSPSSNSMPKVIPFAVVLWSIVQPMSMSLDWKYFALQNPIWNLRPMRYLAIFPHLVNWILLLLSLLLSRVPFNLSHVGWPMLFAATYVAWSVVHFFLKIGKNEPCEVYPINDTRLEPS